MADEALKPGTRVRHAGEQYPEASTRGTAFVVSSFITNGHLEYRIRRDRPLVQGMSRLTDWSSEATVPVVLTPSRCTRSARHWYARYGWVGSSAAFCQHCEAPNPRYRLLDDPYLDGRP